jgi:hypothetical protein
MHLNFFVNFCVAAVHKLNWRFPEASLSILDQAQSLNSLLLTESPNNYALGGIEAPL